MYRARFSAKKGKQPRKLRQRGPSEESVTEVEKPPLKVGGKLIGGMLFDYIQGLVHQPGVPNAADIASQLEAYALDLLDPSRLLTPEDQQIFIDERFQQLQGKCGLKSARKTPLPDWSGGGGGGGSATADSSVLSGYVDLSDVAVRLLFTSKESPIAGCSEKVSIVSPDPTMSDDPDGISSAGEEQAEAAESEAKLEHPRLSAFMLFVNMLSVDASRGLVNEEARVFLKKILNDYLYEHASVGKQACEDHLMEESVKWWKNFRGESEVEPAAGAADHRLRRSASSDGSGEVPSPRRSQGPRLGQQLSRSGEENKEPPALPAWDSAKMKRRLAKSKQTSRQRLGSHGDPRAAARAKAKVVDMSCCGFGRKPSSQKHGR